MEKYTYTLKLLVNIVIARIEAFFYMGNKFLCAYVEEVCRLWAEPRLHNFHQVLISVEALWSQPVL
jgi:hypothetical protein